MENHEIPRIRVEGERGASRCLNINEPWNVVSFPATFSLFSFPEENKSGKASSSSSSSSPSAVFPSRLAVE